MVGRERQKKGMRNVFFEKQPHKTAAREVYRARYHQLSSSTLLDTN